jgi:hypothetical protein
MATARYPKQTASGFQAKPHAVFLAEVEETACPRSVCSTQSIKPSWGQLNVTANSGGVP